MTGFGKAQGSVNAAVVTVESRSVNGRYLELSVKLPRDWSHLESNVRDLVRSKISRGSVNVYIRKEDSAQTNVGINLEAARTYVNILRSLQNELSLSGTVSIDHLASYEPAFQATDTSEVDPWPELQAIVLSSIDQMETMRAREGADLSADMIQRLNGILAGLTEVEALSAARIPQERERLRERVRQLVDEDAIDEQRLQLEIVLLAEKLDVNEECVRLRTHIKHYTDDLRGGGTVGRKLNFLLQEMNREVNTIGSKTNDAAIARIVVGMKEELERIREQVQNLE